MLLHGFSTYLSLVRNLIVPTALNGHVDRLRLCSQPKSSKQRLLMANCGWLFLSFTMPTAYWLIGRWIFESKKRAQASFGPAHCVLADKLAYLAAVDGPSDTPEAAAEASKSAQRASELAASDANTLFNVAQFQWHSGQLGASIRTMKRVIEIDPNHALARSFLIVYPNTCTPAPDDVLAQAISFDKFLGSDNPIRWITLTWLGWLHLNRDEYELAHSIANRLSK